MTEQTILLLCLFGALAATLGLYFLKAFKQTMYQGDERWQAIQLKAEAAANATNWLLLLPGRARPAADTLTPTASVLCMGHAAPILVELAPTSSRPP